MDEEIQKLEKIYQELNEEDTNIKKWDKALIPKAILFPTIAFALIIHKINTDKSILLTYICSYGLFNSFSRYLFKLSFIKR